MTAAKQQTPAQKKASTSYKPQPIVLTALDGYLLSGSLFLPPGPIVTSRPPTSQPSNHDNSNLAGGATHKQDVEVLTKVVIISAATATIQDFYFKFAIYLSQELGFIVVSYDNRGIGRSLPGSESLQFLKAAADNGPLPTTGSTASPPLPPKSTSASNGSAAADSSIDKDKKKKDGKKKKNPLVGFEATIVEWSTKDLPGVFNYVLQHFPDSPTLYVGHSVGGHILPGLDSYYTRNLERVLFVSVTSAYWRHMNSPLFTYWFFHMASPIVNRHYGYYPGKTFWGSMEDMPTGCLETWGFWSKHRDYMLGGNPEWKPNFDLFKVPIYSLYFSDDDYSSTSAPIIMDLIPNTQRRCVGVKPVEDLNMKKVGHMGFFFNSCKQKLWNSVVRSWFVDGRALDIEAIREHAALESSYARL
ncbi:hypothetical protein EC957_009418 [Mortierella hygrophila]|uniref:Uncharacterized protein n=1 Tax=Mortierella hygrophila TaxID=979708 RepID=A0A9P6JXX9_9FUNG|nr:hypothetical protein EC957_009418 [Mortierella hygrophila]